MTAILIAIVVAVAVLTGLCYFRANGWAWVATVAAYLIATMLLLPGQRGILLWVVVWLAFSAIAVLLNYTSLRRKFLSDPLFIWYKKLRPAVSQTEQEALEAGTVWWDGELFTGKPNWNKLRSYPKPILSAEEQAFLDGPVEQLCAMVDDRKITHELYDLPPEVWRFIGEKGFLGDARSADELAARALETGVIPMADMEILRRSKQLTRKVIVVDDFPQDFGRATAQRAEPHRVSASAYQLKETYQKSHVSGSLYNSNSNCLAL